jgi:GT2 family glycosyltransferase
MILSVIIVNYRNPALLRLALSSLARVWHFQDTGEVIVIDSESTHETQAVAQAGLMQFRNNHYIPYTENTGYTRGVNEGIRKATGDYILTLNPDIVMQDGAIEHLIAVMKDNSSIGLLGPKLLNMDGTRQDSCFRFYRLSTIVARRIGGFHTEENRFLMRDSDLTQPCDVDWLMGSALMTSRNALTMVGLMDESFFLYYSEVDWALRFWENGYRVVYDPSVSLYHYHQRESNGYGPILDLLLRRQARWHVSDGIRFFSKHGISPTRPTTNQSHAA